MAGINLPYFLVSLKPRSRLKVKIFNSFSFSWKSIFFSTRNMQKTWYTFFFFKKPATHHKDSIWYCGSDWFLKFLFFGNYLVFK
jgi:hypothetical protein